MNKVKHQKIIYRKSELNKLDSIGKEIESVWKLSGCTFEKQSTTYTRKYKRENELIEIIPESKDLAGYGANFVKQIKDYFSTKQLPKRLSDNLPYCEYFKPISTYTEIENVCEIDLNKAYWTAARNLGYLSEGMYKKALSPKINKLSRLVALGVLGKKTSVSIFEPPYSEIETNVEYAKTRPFWDNIVFETGKVLEETVNHYSTHVYGVWFDAIFCDSKIAQPLRKFLLRRGYEASVEQISSYTVQPREGVIPGAKIKRVFRNGDIKEMDVSYRSEKMSFEQFLIQVLS